MTSLAWPRPRHHTAYEYGSSKASGHLQIRMRRIILRVK